MSESQPAQGMIPANLVPLIFQGFSTLNTNASRPAIKDDEMFWCDGFMPVGASYLRTLPDVGTPIYTASGSVTVAFYDFVNIGALPYCIAYLSDGSIQAINTDTLALVQIAKPGTITNVNRSQVGTSQWGSTYALIVANQTNGYFVWDGKVFYKSGADVPNMGTMPTGIQGTGIETYVNRVWITGNANLTFSAPSSVTNFATADGGGVAPSTDSFLRVSYTRPVQTNGFLYLIADSSVNYISGVTTTGTPATTTYTNQNADPETGSPWPGSITVFGRNIMLANAFGAHVSYGGAVSKVSEPLDGIYNTVPNFGGLIPSAAKAIIYGKRVWLLLLPVISPISGQQINTMFMWDGKKWWSSQQSPAISYIQYQEINSVLTAYGTDGKSIYPLFQNPSDTFTKTVQSRLWDKGGDILVGKTATRLWGLVRYDSDISLTLDVSIDSENGESSSIIVPLGAGGSWINANGNTGQWVNSSDEAGEWNSGTSGISTFPPTAVGQQGVLLGLTVTTNAADVTLIKLVIGSGMWEYRG